MAKQPMDVQGFLSNQLDGNTAIRYKPDYVGSVQLLENSGFNPFSDSSPITSTLNHIFNRFVQKTGLDTNSNQLRDEFLQSNPGTQNAISIYNALENTFATKSTDQKAAIVDFLNSKIDNFISQKDLNDNNQLTQEESGLTDTLFSKIDANRDMEINAEELQGNFYNDFNQLNSVLDYFQNTPGALLDLYG
jgi:hypothetical protein